MGQQSVIRITARSNAPTEQPYVNIVEVRNGIGITVYLAWQGGTAAPDSDFIMEFSWTPHAECSFPNEACSNYEIRTFAISSIINPRVLSPVSNIGGIAVTGPPISHGLEHYDLFLNNQTFQIGYSFSGGGRITDIQADVETTSMLFSVVAPADGTLMISMSEESSEYLFPDDKEKELYVFVDEVAVDMTWTVDGRTGSFIFEIPIERGSEQIEIVGNALI